MAFAPPAKKEVLEIPQLLIRGVSEKGRTFPAETEIPSRPLHLGLDLCHSCPSAVLASTSLLTFSAYKIKVTYSGLKGLSLLLIKERLCNNEISNCICT